MIWWIIGVPAAIAVAVILSLILVRASRPSTRQMQGAQDRLNKKMGTPVPTAPVQPDSGGMGAKWNKAIRALILLFSLLAAAGIGWALWSAYRSSEPVSAYSPTLAGTWAWMKAYWFWIFLLCGLLYAIGSMIPKVAPKDGKGKKEKHQACTVLHGLAYAGVFTFIGVAVAHDIFVSPLPRFAPNYSLPTVPNGNCRKACAIALPRYGSSLPLPVPVGMQPHVDDSSSGYVITCVYADGSEGILGDAVRPCHDGNIRYVYLTDTSGRDTNIVLYSPIYPPNKS